MSKPRSSRTIFRTNDFGTPDSGPVFVYSPGVDTVTSGSKCVRSDSIGAVRARSLGVRPHELSGTSSNPVDGTSVNIMNTNLDSIDLEHDLIQWTVTETVRAGLTTPLRDPILDAVDGLQDEPNGEKEVDDVAESSESASSDADRTGTHLATRTLQGLAVFFVLFVVLYTSMKRLIGDDGG